ncbi:hypothetical protein H072_232 [Dactylellina haptotyla CBS 200.50]|uniref:Fungal N-terminal domain-containing protein n=1 Tax=Dactylellina haptotyla (strain CBS 200.50) TaxID=1284197 RepID=S8ASD5_DACHA|nr:hypothetical protein H072_232 [Dactylellina haptotyla CBS 200.50]
MASPVSIGDAFLLAKLALVLGQAFTTGRKSAPAEFQEVESQLYSISTALSALDVACKNGSIALNVDSSGLPSSLESQRNKADDALVSMLQGCQDMLKHLESVVEKYSSINEPEKRDISKTRKWTSELKKNWKKVWWTTEGGDLAALRRSLAIHLNCLNLALGVINNTQTGKVGAQVDHVSVMLTEIHTWFVDNIKNPRTGTPSIDQRINALSVNDGPLANIQFELVEESSNGQAVLCPKAAVDSKWNQVEDGDPQPKLFHCNCAAQPGQPAPHHFQLDSLQLSPVSFALRHTGNIRSWMVYKVANRATNRLASLTVKNVPASQIHDFEAHFIDLLASIRARLMLRRGGTMLAYTTPGPAESEEARILNLMSDMQKTQGQVDKVTFTINRQSYSRTGIEAIQLLHYKTLNKEYRTVDFAIYPKDLLPLNTAELVISYKPKSSGGDITKTVLYLTHKTVIKYLAATNSVVLDQVDCAGLTPGDQESILRGVDVSIQLASTEAALELRKKLQDMRVELFVIALRAPRDDERIALKAQCRGFHTEKVDVVGADVSILQSETSGRLRLVVVSNDEATILSQELAENFMAAGERPTFTSPTHVVQVLDYGTREIRKHENGFNFVDFSDVYVDRLFSLGLAAFSGNEVPAGPISRSLDASGDTK